jgi:hypothetical protein
VPKEDRIAAVAQWFRAYHIKDDPGGDVADAIGLSLWWIRELAIVPF